MFKLLLFKLSNKNTQNFTPYPEIVDANFKCALWIFNQKLALKMRVRFSISIVLL